MLAVVASLACCNVTLDIGNYHTDVNYQLSLKWGWGLARAEQK